MANIGSEIIRALKWRDKGNEALSHRALVRAFELLDLSLDAAETPPRRREFARLREALVDFFYCSNSYGSTHDQWMSYFNHFNYAARLGPSKRTK
jgi:hypothetical protein